MDSRDQTVKIEEPKTTTKGLVVVDLHSENMKGFVGIGEKQPRVNKRD